MNQIKIGKFIAEMRKEQNLTQLDLAEKLGISNKTVSKWECGNGMPDYAVMEDLCEILKISVNDLLSGERLSLQEYNKKAEENIISLMQESTENYKRDMREWIGFLIGIAVLGLLVVMTIIMWGGFRAIGYFIDIPILVYLLAITLLVLCMTGLQKDFVKAFPLAMKKMVSTESQQLRKSILAVKTTMVSINVVGVLSFGIGVVSTFSLLTDAGDFGKHVLVASLSILYGAAVTLLLIPIYVRLKKKQIEE